MPPSWPEVVYSTSSSGAPGTALALATERLRHAQVADALDCSWRSRSLSKSPGGPTSAARVWHSPAR